MSKTSEPVEICYEHIRQRTEDAVLFTVEEVDVWLPKKLISNWDTDDKTLEVPEWLAIDRELV